MVTFNRVLRDGLSIPVTFRFRHAGTVTVSVSTGARPDVLSSMLLDV